jgi:hypothetical protein
MAAANTDKFSKAYQRLSTTLSADKPLAASTMSLSSAANFPTDTGVIATVYELDSDGVIVTSSVVSYAGVVSGSQITNLTVVEGTDQAHTAGDVVSLYFTAEHWNRAMGGVLVEHGQDGTHTDITTDSINNAGVLTQTGVATFANHIDVNDSSTAVRDTSDNELLKFAKTASAVNELTITNAATGNGPEIQATGGDTNIDVEVITKGTGKLKVNGNPFDDGDLTTFTTTWTNLTVGNGTTSYKYMQQGKWVRGFVWIKFGTTSSISGTVSFSLPVTAATLTAGSDVAQIGTLRILDSGVASYYGPVKLTSTTTARTGVLKADSTYVLDVALSSTVPMTWGTNDELYATFEYIAA